MATATAVPDAVDPPSQGGPGNDIPAKVAAMRAANISEPDIEKYLVEHEGLKPADPHASAKAFAAGPTTDRELGTPPDGPGVLSRTGSNIIGFIKQAATHPLDTAAGVATAPIKSLGTAFAPAIGELPHDLRLTKGGNFSGQTDKDRATPYDAAHGGVTMGQRMAGAAQTLANVAAPGIAKTVGGLGGLAVAGGIGGAAYNPSDPAAGALTGAVMAPALGTLAKGGGKGLSIVRNAPADAYVDLAKSFVPSRTLTALQRFAKVSGENVPEADAQASTAAEPATPKSVPGTLTPAERQQLAQQGFTPELIDKVEQTAIQKAQQASVFTSGTPSVASMVKQAPSAGVSDVLTPEAKAAWQAKAVETLMPHRPDVASNVFARGTDVADVAPQSHRTLEQFAQDAERLGVHGGVENTPQPRQSVQSLIKKAGGKVPADEAAGQWGDAEEAQGLAPHQQPDLEEQLRQWALSKGWTVPTAPAPGDVAAALKYSSPRP